MRRKTGLFMAMMILAFMVSMFGTLSAVYADDDADQGALGGNHDCSGNLVEVSACDATCETEGYAFDCYRCQICGNYYEDASYAEKGHPINTDKLITPPLGHDWQTVSIIREVTADQAGLEHQKCSRCGKERDQVIPRDLVKITAQPEDQDVNYPDGVSFHVEVDRPENVKSYRWEMRTEGVMADTIFQLLGISAGTDTLIIPSTEHDIHPWYFKCYITDIDGTVIETEEAELTIANPKAQKSVLYIGEYAIEPGEKLDLKDTPYGSGRITYDADKINMTFDSIRYNNEEAIFDDDICPGTGIYFFSNEEKGKLEYHMHFNGNSVIDNQYFDESENKGGITLNSHFGAVSDTNVPALVIDGDSPLTLRGGEYCIYSNGDVELAGDIITEPIGTNYTNAVRGHTILIDEGVTANLRCCGTALMTQNGDLRIYKGAEVFIDSIAPHVSVGHTASSIIRVKGGSMYLDGARLNIKGSAVPDNFVPYKTFLANLNGISFDGTLNLNDSDVTVNMDAEDSDTSYASNYCGIAGNDGASLIAENTSSIDINIDDSGIFGATGIIVDNKILTESDSDISVNINTDGKVTGIRADGLLSLEDTAVEVKAVSSCTVPDIPIIGILCDTASITANDAKHQLYCKTEGVLNTSGETNTGTAFIAGVNEKADGDIGFDPAYTPSRIILGGAAMITLPKSSAISSYSYPMESWTIAAETIYDTRAIANDSGQTDTSAQEGSSAQNTSVQANTPVPAEEICIAAPQKLSQLIAEGNTVKVKASKLKKKKYTVKAGRAITVTGAAGDITYQLDKITAKKKILKQAKKKIRVSRTGKIILKKGLKKGKYKLTITVSDTGSVSYAPGQTSTVVKLIVK